MKLGFFEEYPSDKTLAKIRMLPADIDLYIGCKSVKEFLGFKEKIKKDFENVREIAYWPILEMEEGYWLSGFSKTSAIIRVLEEIKNCKESFPILWDAEVPTLNKKLFLTQLLGVSKNTKIIQSALLNQEKNHHLTVAQVPIYGFVRHLALKSGVFFPFTNYHRLDMVYTSMLPFLDGGKYLRKIVRENKAKYREYSVGLGVIDRGEGMGKVMPLMKVKQLDRDLEICKEEGIKNVIIYRLGGLNEEYLSICLNYLK